MSDAERDDWYERRDELRSGDKFICQDRNIVELIDREEGDGSKWIVADFYRGSFFHDGRTIEPGDLDVRLDEHWAPTEEMKLHG